jgi:hypothetical protein
MHKPDTTRAPDKHHTGGAEAQTPALLRLQQQVGNRAVQRLLAQRQGDGSFELDDETAGRINQARGGGQALDNAVQKQMSASMGHDFSGVRVQRQETPEEEEELAQTKALQRQEMPEEEELET